MNDPAGRLVRCRTVFNPAGLQAQFGGPTGLIAQIEAVARQQRAQHGTAGLSLHGIAREMGITAPAIYNYFPQLEDLITALIVDAFNAPADAMEAAEVAEASERPYDKIMALCMAYQEWAVAHPTVFQLIYGNPIPGHHAPEEITIPLGSRSPTATGAYRWTAGRLRSSRAATGMSGLLPFPERLSSSRQEA